MKDIDITVLLAVFYEMLGPLLWILIAAVLAGTLAFGLLLLRERGLRPARLVRMQFLGLLGGAAALWLMARVSSSGFTDAGGPVDWLLIALVFMLGWVGASVILYTLAGWCRCRRAQCGTGPGRGGPAPERPLPASDTPDADRLTSKKTTPTMRGLA